MQTIYQCSSGNRNQNQLDRNYQNLIIAIIKMAIYDYIQALKTLKMNQNNIIAQDKKANIEKFFLSEHYKSLSNFDGQEILNRVKKEFAKDSNVRIRI